MWRRWGQRTGGTSLQLMFAIYLVSAGAEVSQVIFRSMCYHFHFSTMSDTKTWPQAAGVCHSAGGFLSSVADEEENSFLADAFAVGAWNMWLGLQFDSSWIWTDGSSASFFLWGTAVSNLSGYCAMMSLNPSDPSLHGTWTSTKCTSVPSTGPTGFICKSQTRSCSPDPPSRLPVSGGLTLYSAVDLLLTLPVNSSCTIAFKETRVSSPVLLITLNRSASGISGNALSQFGATQDSPLTPSDPRSDFIWSANIFPSEVKGFVNYQENVRIPGSHESFLKSVDHIEISGARLSWASLGFSGSFDMRFPCCAATQDNYVRLERASETYLTRFTLGVWVKSSTSSPGAAMCICSYAVKDRPAELALFTLLPAGLELRLKGSVALNGSSGNLLDERWHHIALLVSNDPSAPQYLVFIDGFPWSPDYVDPACFRRKGISLGGSLVLGQLEELEKGGFHLANAFFGDVSELNLWDTVLPPHVIRLLASTKLKWKFPGNVVGWMSLADRRQGAVRVMSPGQSNDAPFMWFGLLYSVGASAHLCVNATSLSVYMEAVQAKCANNSFWALQQNGRLRNVMIPASCITVFTSSLIQMTPDCEQKVSSAFRLLPDGRIQNLYTGFCLTYRRSSKLVALEECSPASLYFELKDDALCPQGGSWRQWRGRCVYIEPVSALSWWDARTFCQRFTGSDLITLNDTDKVVPYVFEVIGWVGSICVNTPPGAHIIHVDESPSYLPQFSRNWLKTFVKRSSWIGLNDLSKEGDHVWPDGSPLHPSLYRQFLFASSTDRNRYDCVAMQPAGYWADSDCAKPMGPVCEFPARTDLFIPLRGKYLYGALATDTAYSDLTLAKEYCRELGTGCSAVVTMRGRHYLYFGVHFANLEDPSADSGAVTYIKSRCQAGMSGADCQSLCPVCPAGLECNPAIGMCDGMIFYRKDPSTDTGVFYHIKCPPFSGWSLASGFCVYAEGRIPEAEERSACARFLAAGAKAQLLQDTDCVKGVSDQWGDVALQCPPITEWTCERPVDAAFAVYEDRLVISDSDSSLWTGSSLAEAQEICYMMATSCSAVVHVKGAYYCVTGTAIADSPGAALYVKTACAAGYFGAECEDRCPPCHPSQICNPWTGTCDGFLRCVRSFSLSCAYGLTSARCPPGAGWWWWSGHCYYVETEDRKSWSAAEVACNRHKGTGLLVIDSQEEKTWISAMITESSWTGLNDEDEDRQWSWGDGRPADISAAWLREVSHGPSGCVAVGPAGKLVSQADCGVLRLWVCERDEAVSLFQEYPGHALLTPLSVGTSRFDSLVAAQDICLLESGDCTGVTEREGEFVLVRGTKMVASRSEHVRAFVKTACAIGYYGIKCSSGCPECPHGVACNPVTGACDNLVTCVSGLRMSGCHRAVSLECPQERGWWYWGERCYYVSEENETQTWRDANTSCSSYRGSWLLTINSLEEKEWVSSMINSRVWTGLSTTTRGLIWIWADGQKVTASAPWFSITPLGFILNTLCVDLSPSPGSLAAQDCLTPRGWVCEQPVQSVFQKYPGMGILHPLPQGMAGHTLLRPALMGCLARIPQCTGVTLWNGKYFSVTGIELVRSTRPADGAFLRTACAEGFFGPRCAQRCRVCLRGLVCNALQGQCQGTQECAAQGLEDCEYVLTSSLCPSSLWRLWRGRCYYIETVTTKTERESAMFCETFRETRLMGPDTEEKTSWMVEVIKRAALAPVDGRTGYWLMGSEAPTASACPVITSTGVREERGCGVPSFFICEGKEGVLSRCPADPRWQHWRGSCYYVDRATLATWREARLICNSYKETQLLYLTSTEEMDAISLMFEGSLWTGLTDRDVESVFIWTTGEEVSAELSRYLRNDMADGGLKDCVQINAGSRILTDRDCDEKKPFICKCPEDTDWFDEVADRGLPGDLSATFPSESDLIKAKETCLRLRSLCVAVIEREAQFYLITTSAALEICPNATAYRPNICAHGVSGKECLKPPKPSVVPSCHCSGSIATSLGVVCGVPVADCIDWCRKQKLREDCSKCVPACPAGVLREEELSVISIMEYKAQQFLLHVAEEDTEPQNASRNILYRVDVT